MVRGESEGTEMNGIRLGDEVILITHFPGYKKPALAVQTGCVIRKVATFNSEKDAEYFNAIFNKWLGLEDVSDNREAKSEDEDGDASA